MIINSKQARIGVFLVSWLILNAESHALTFNCTNGTFVKNVKSFKELKTEHVVLQSIDFSCGPACIATILSYHFLDKTNESGIINYLLLTADIAKVKARKGFSLLDLKNYCRAKGYEAIGYRMTLEDLAALNGPALIPINIKDYNHFVVLRGFAGGRVFIADPVLGNLTMTVDKFRNIWKGNIAMVLEKQGSDTRGSLLRISDQESSFWQKDNMVQHMLSESMLGKVYADGEFK